MAAMVLPLALALCAAALLAVRVARLRRAHAAEHAALSERLNELAARVEAAEQDVAQALTHAQVAGTLLLEKGIADEEDVEAVRRRVDEAGPVQLRHRDGDLH
jgi:tetrahydromethanopterin S-methyltransferase subunit G